MAVQINVAANQAALTASIQAGVQAYNQRFAQNNQLNLTINPRAFSQPLGRITGDVKDFEAALAASNARVIAFGASTAVLGGVIRSFKELANVTIEVEKNLADINRVFGLTTSQLQKFSTDLFNVTKQTASSFNDASQAALEFSRQGLKAEETLQRTKDALTLTRLAGISTANAVDALTSTVNGFSATGVTTTQILNKLVAVEQDFAVGAGDLAEALSRTGQAAQEAGVSLDQLNALVTSAQQSTARGGAVIGNALKTIFTRLQRTDTLDQLEAFNIAVRDVQGNILPAVTILQNFAGAYRGLADAQRAQLSEQVAGVYQVNILKAIVNDLNQSQGVYAGALQRGTAATNEAEVATAKLNQTLDALLKQTATSTQQLANNIGKVTFEPLARYGTEQLKSLVESMNEILEGEGIGSTFANGLLKGIRNILAGPGAIAAFFTLFKLIQNSFTYLSQALPQIAGITTETQNRKNIEQAILQIMSQQGPVAQALAGTMGNQAAQAQLLLQVARQQTAEYQTQTTLARQLAAQLAGQGVRVRGAGGLQVTRAGGYIPASTKMAEVVGAQAGGYAPGKVVKSPVGGVMNTAEDVKYVPGFAQPFINPPAGSKAGRAHRQNSISRTGIDPYMYGGFIPNFALKNISTIEKIKDGDTISAFPVDPTIVDYRLAGADAPERGQLGYNEATQLLAQRYSGDAGLNLMNANVTKGKAAYGRGVFDDLEVSRDLIEKGLAVPDLRYTRDETSLNTAKNYYENTYKKGSRAANNPGLWAHVQHPKFQQFIHQFELLEGKEVEYKTAAAGERVIKNTDLYKKLLYKKTKEQFEFSGFIPNFATPMSTASIPWFKKYSSKYKNAAGDADLFKMGDFPTYGRGLDHEYAKKGNSAMLSYLHEDFVRSALNIALGSKKVIRPAEVGFKDKPVSDISNENDFDLLYRIADGSYDLLELKQDFKNISGSVSGFMNKKLENAKKDNPELVKKVRSMIAVSNRPKFTDPTGRNAGANFSEFEMAAASIVKDKYSNVDPSISAKLTKVTDGLLRRYEAKKNTTYDGFIPNFAYVKSMIARVIPNTFRSLTDTKGTAFSNTNIGIARQKSFQSYNLTDEQVLSQAELNYPNLIMSILGNNAFIPDIDAIDKQSAGAQVYSAANNVSSFGGTTANKSGQYNPFGGGAYKGNPELIGTGSVQGKAIKLSYANVGKLGRRWEKSKDPVVKDAWANLQKYAKMKLINKAKNSYTGNEGTAFLNENSRSWYIDDIDKNLRKYSEILKTEYNNYLKSINRIGTYVDIKGSAEAGLFGKDVNYMALRPDVLNKQLQGLPKFDWKNAVDGIFYGDYKNNKEKYDRLAELMGKKWTYNNASKRMFLQSGGFIPNFAYKQAVMGLEESMSGNKAIFDTKPFPHIRNSSQPTFSSAISDHGGLNNALSDSMRGQKAAGLMSQGFVPNFATLDVRQSLGSAFNSLTSQQQTQFLELNRALSQLARNTNLTTQQQNALRQTIRTNANALEVSTGSTRIVNDANRALGVSLQQNANAQRTAAAQQQRQNTQNQQQNRQNQQGNTQQNVQSISQMYFGERGQRADRFASSRLGGLTGILGGAMIGGQIESFIQGGRERYEMSTAERFGASAGSGVLSAATTGAEIGAFIPVLGPAAGAAIGSLIGLGKAAYDSQTTLEDLTAAAEDYKTKTSQTISTAEAYINKLQSLSQIEDPFEKIKASDELQNLFEKLRQTDLTGVFKSTAGSVAEMQKAIIEFTKKTNQVKSIQEFSKTVKGIDDKTETPFFDIKSFQEKIQKDYGYTISGGLGQSTSSQNMYVGASGAIQKTEANLQRSFEQYQTFFSILSSFDLDEKQIQAFVEEFAKETNSFFNVNPDAIKEIAQKYGISEEAAKELGKFGEEVLGRSGIVGTFFSKNLPEITKRFINKSNVDFKTNIQKAEIKGVLVAPLIKTIKDSIEDYVFNTASKLQNMEFDSNRLKILENAANEYLDSISSPLEKASREAVSKTREAATKTEESRMRFTSGFVEKIGSKLPLQLGGSDVKAVETIGKLVKNFETSSQEDQLEQINKLIGDTDSLEATRNAGYENIKPEEIKSLNAELRKERDSLMLLMQAKKENSQLLNLEIDVNKRRADSAQRLLILQNQLVESDTKRAISIASQKASIDIRENALQNTRKTPGFGFGMSEGQINTETTMQNRQLMMERQSLTRADTLGNIKSQLKSTLFPILTPIKTAFQEIEKVSISEQPNLYKNLGLDKVNISDMTDLFNLNDMLDKINDSASLESFRKNLEDIFSNIDPTSVLYKPLQDQIGVISQTLIGLNKESKIFESNSQADIKIADVNDRINNGYIFRLNTLLQIEKAQRGILNTIEIEEQRLDAAKSRPANFFGLGVTGKAEKQIGFDEQNLALRQRRQNAQAVQNVQQQLNQFETFRNKTQAEGIGLDSFGFPASQEEMNKAKTAISNLDTSKITNVDQAKAFVEQLSKIRIENGLQGEAAKTLADTEKEINSILNSNVDELNKMRSIQDILNGKVRQEAKDRQSIRMGFKEGFDQIQDDADTGLNRLAKDTPILFRDGMVSAIKATIREADNLESALMGIASNFLDTFSTQLMNIGVSKIISGSGLGSVFGAQTGGLIRAQSGMYISGSGSGDKYPALLENGEYVLNRNAVMAMGGPAALDTLNFSAAPRFAAGGSFGFDLVGSRSDQDTLANMEKYMTSEGLDNSPLYKELSDAAKQKNEKERQERRAKKQQRAAMIGSLVAAVATIAIGAGISNIAQNAQATKAKAFSAQMAETRGSNPLMMSGKEFSQLQKFQSSNLISPTGFSYIGGVPQTGFKSIFSSPLRSGQLPFYQRGSMNPFAPKVGGKQIGGLIGSRLSDTIPGYMEGGLYNSSMVKKYGTGMQVGGSSLMAAGNNSSTVNNNTNANNSFNFNTSIERDGSIKMGSNTTSYQQQDIELSKNLNARMYAVVTEVIRKEKQFGGSLAGVRNS